MEITEGQQDGFLLLSLAGEMDASNAPQLEERVTALIDGGATQILMDCSQLDYVSSAGLRVFLMTAKLVKQAGGKLGLVGVQELVKDVFDMAGFARKFAFFPTREEAAAGLG